MYHLFLSKPSGVYQTQYIDMVQVWAQTGENFVPWVLKLDYHPFDKLLTNLENLRKGVSLPAGQVSCSTFWLIRSDGKVVGAVNIRHKLNTYLMEYGGHIGYGICPIYRQKGYGKRILQLALTEARQLGINRVRITCNDDNIASEKIILHNGGVFDSKGVEEGIIIKRFWIENKRM